jgi:hypothetical protein
MDPAWQQEPYSGGYADSYPASSETYAAMTPSSDPQAAGYVMGATNDVEIDSTLSGYGEWIEVEGYGRVWRPYTSSVGLDFTPYESCGSWVWTEDWGWTYACEWDWGWLPFHYGRWGWFEDYWAWQPGYDWSPGWVEWRSGDDYCGWRPLSPAQGYWDNGSWVGGGGGGVAIGGGGSPSYGSSGGGWNIRDHRDNPSPGSYTIPKDYKIPALRDSQWRFTRRDDFGKKIRPNLFKAPAEGLRVTKLATRPPMKGTTRAVNAASIMGSRLVTREAIRARAASRVDISRQPHLDRARTMPDGSRPTPARPADRAVRDAQSPVERMWPRPAPVDRSFDRPRTHGPGRPGDAPGARGVTSPGRVPDHAPGPPPGDIRPPSAPPRGERDWPPPSRPSSPPPARDYSPKSQPSRDYSPPSRPARDYSPPSQPSRDHSPPSRPSRDDSSSRSSGGNWSPPSRGSSSPSSGGGSSSSPSRGSSGGGYSGGGGGGGSRRR